MPNTTAPQARWFLFAVAFGLILLSPLCGCRASIVDETSYAASIRLQSYLDTLGFVNVTRTGPIRGIYISWRDINWAAPELTVNAAVDAGYNAIFLAFLLSSGPADMVQAWASVPAARKNASLQYAHANGAVVLLAVGGETEAPYSSWSPAAYGARAAQFALDNQLDGVDFDLELLQTYCTYTGMNDTDVVDWIVDASLTAREVMGPSRLLTHAPQAPYFGAIGGRALGVSPPYASQIHWAGPTGCYTAVWLNATYTAPALDLCGNASASAPNASALDAAVNATSSLCANATDAGNVTSVTAASIPAIDWFNIQAYNQGAGCYNSYTSLFRESAVSDGGSGCDYFPGTSVAEVARYGVPLHTLVVGKPTLVGDAGSGWVDPADLGGWVANASALSTAAGGVQDGSGASWAAGAFAWSWKSTGGDSANWQAAVFPAYASASPTPSVSPTSSVTASSSGSLSASCSPSATASLSVGASSSPSASGTATRSASSTGSPSASTSRRPTESPTLPPSVSPSSTGTVSAPPSSLPSPPVSPSPLAGGAGGGGGTESIGAGGNGTAPGAEGGADSLGLGVSTDSNGPGTLDTRRLGIVTGCVTGAAVFLGLLIFAVIRCRRRARIQRFIAAARREKGGAVIDIEDIDL